MMNKTIQYSDFASRYAIYELEKEKQEREAHACVAFMQKSHAKQKRDANKARRERNRKH